MPPLPRPGQSWITSPACAGTGARSASSGSHRLALIVTRTLTQQAAAGYGAFR